MGYMLTYSYAEWVAIADRLAHAPVSVSADLPARIRGALAHHQQGCECPITIEVTAADADTVQAVHAGTEGVAITSLAP